MARLFLGVKLREERPWPPAEGGSEPAQRWLRRAALGRRISVERACHLGHLSRLARGLLGQPPRWMRANALLVSCLVTNLRYAGLLRKGPRQKNHTNVAQSAAL